MADTPTIRLATVPVDDTANMRASIRMDFWHPPVVTQLLDIAKSPFCDVANKAPTIPRAEPMTQPTPSKVGTPWVVGHTEAASVKAASHTSLRPTPPSSKGIAKATTGNMARFATNFRQREGGES